MKLVASIPLAYYEPFARYRSTGWLALILAMMVLLTGGCATGKHSALVVPGPPRIGKDFDFEQLPRFQDDYCKYILYEEGPLGSVLKDPHPAYYCDFSDAAKAITTDPETAKEKAKYYRDKILDKFMSEIDNTYHEYNDGMYMGKASQAVAGDIASLGLTAATAITLVTRTKTILAALATGVAGVNLSFDKNFFGQQTFSALAIAMQARRDKAKSTIDDNRKMSAADYTLEGGRRDLVSYFFAGTLPGAIQEIQEEAAAASRAVSQPKPDTAAGAATKLAFSTPPSDSSPGALALAVQVQDDAGKVVTTATNSIVVTSTIGGTPGPTATANAIAGVAKFSLTFEKEGTYTVKATADGLNPVTSKSFDIKKGTTPTAKTPQPAQPQVRSNQYLH
jgi:hypothetical protein